MGGSFQLQADQSLGEFVPASSICQLMSFFFEGTASVSDALLPLEQEPASSGVQGLLWAARLVLFGPSPSRPWPKLRRSSRGCMVVR